MEKHVIIITIFMIISMKEICECCFERERNGLLQIKSSFNQNLPNMLSSWDTLDANCCNWEGVNCNSTTGHVTGLQLSGGIITGSPDSVLNWYLNASLFLSFPQLNQLSLKANNISGCLHNEGFEKLSMLADLETLDLSYNNFNNNILQSLSDLPSLRSLYLSYNQLNGTINISEFNNMESLDFSGNQFNQTITKFLQNTGRMSSLTSLSLKGCGLIGNILNNFQGFCRLKHLVRLDLNDNDLNGNLPQCLANFTFLQYLDLSNTSFQIPISLTPLFNLSRLKVFYAGPNIIYADREDNNLNPKFQLSNLALYGYGEVGELPEFLYHQNQLSFVLISSLKLRGRFPYWLLQNNTRLYTLILTSNSLSGNIQLPYKVHASLSDLDISDNFFNGTIPSKIGVFFPSLSILDMSRNKLKGSIPDSLCQSTHLSFLDISQNNMSGTIPNCIGNMSQLEILDLSTNSISGSLPSNFSSSFLRVVNLSKNRLQGSLRDAFHSYSDLFQLDLSRNNFSGSIPSSIWILLPKLRFLMLGHNNFRGVIPVEFCKLKQLSFIDLSHNSIVGHMLPCLNITSYWSRGQSILEQIDGVEITMKGRTYIYEKTVLIFVTGIDMSSNNLTGQIPAEIGDLRSIKALNLSRNCLTGTIPQTISNLKDIESLDISHNNLHGAIPYQLTRLTSLAVFNVSYNNLSGQIPNQVAQFGTFTESSYRGNPFLCGWPLSKSCSTPDSPPSNATVPLIGGDGSNKYIDMEDFFISFFVGYATVLLTLVAVLCINPYWRRVWFYHIQMSIDKTYYFIGDNVIPIFIRF